MPPENSTPVEVLILPDDVDPQTPISDMLPDDLRRIVASLNGRRRWMGVSDRKIAAHARAMVKARENGMTAADKTAAGRSAARKRWGKNKAESAS